MTTATVPNTQRCAWTAFGLLSLAKTTTRTIPYKNQQSHHLKASSLTKNTTVQHHQRHNSTRQKEPRRFRLQRQSIWEGFLHAGSLNTAQQTQPRNRLIINTPTPTCGGRNAVRRIPKAGGTGLSLYPMAMAGVGEAGWKMRDGR